jgi:hypothetical protein
MQEGRSSRGEEKSKKLINHVLVERKWETFPEI